MTTSPAMPTGLDRLALIAAARRAVLDGTPRHTPPLAPWIERSWLRCLASGQHPEQRLGCTPIPAHTLAQVQEAHRDLREAARPVLEALGRAMTHSRYFAILTNAQGVVVDVNGAFDPRDPRAHLITRIGADLSEASLGTSAISAALIEQQPVWLHRGEHFFAMNAGYSCAGAPVAGPDGHCIGMLDLTGIDTAERPELRHLVARSARSIENALVLRQPHQLLLRLNWPGQPLGDEADGLLALDGDGRIGAANPAARAMIPALSPGQPALHASEVFALPYATLFDACASGQPLEVPLWSGLRLRALAQRPGQPLAAHPPRPASHSRPLRDVELALIRQAVAEAQGNIQQAARRLGISRATIYRKLGHK